MLEPLLPAPSVRGVKREGNSLLDRLNEQAADRRAILDEALELSLGARFAWNAQALEVPRVSLELYNARMNGIGALKQLLEAQQEGQQQTLTALRVSVDCSVSRQIVLIPIYI